MTCPPRFGTPRTPSRKTLGGAVGVLAAMLGKPLMEWQQYVVDVVLEIDPATGELAYNEWSLTVPRQSGKTTLLLAKNSHRCMATGFFGPNQQVAYAAQTKLKATEKFEKDYALTLRQAARSSAVLKQVKVRTGNVKVDIRYPNGSVWAVESGTEKSGHGSTLDSADVDEAFSQVDNRLEQAFSPAMITRRNRQLGIVSTAGWEDASPYLLGKVQVGRKAVADGVTHGLAYFEWSAPDDADPGDERVWLACMPALHRPDCLPGCALHTIQVEAIRAEYDKALRENKLTEFSRAYLNQWRPKPRPGDETALGNWSACLGSFTADAPLPAVAAIAVSVAKGRDSAAIGGCGWVDDTPVVSLVDERPGVEWVKGEASRIGKQCNVPVAVLVTGPAGEKVAADIEALGAEVVRAKLPEYVIACDDIYDRVTRQAILHPGDSALNDSVIGARWRPCGDGRRVFGWRASESNLAPTEAVTLALWAAQRETESVYETRGLLTL